MKINGMADPAALQRVFYHDNQGMTQIKHQQNQEAALEQVAGQFEAMFLQMVLRQMRTSSDVLAHEDSPFTSKKDDVFRDMYDGQLSIEMAKKQQGGIADMLVKQLRPAYVPEHAMPSGMLPDPSMKSTFAARTPPVFDAANDDVSLDKVELGSQGQTNCQMKGSSSLNDSAASVANLLQPQGTVSSAPVSIASAFSQPLIRKMER